MRCGTSTYASKVAIFAPLRVSSVGQVVPPLPPNTSGTDKGPDHPLFLEMLPSRRPPIWTSGRQDLGTGARTETDLFQRSRRARPAATLLAALEARTTRTDAPCVVPSIPRI